jgi:hypothetical protein
MELILTVELIAGLLFLVVVGLSRIEHELMQRSHRSLLVDPEREQRSRDAIAAWKRSLRRAEGLCDLEASTGDRTGAST